MVDATTKSSLTSKFSSTPRDGGRRSVLIGEYVNNCPWGQRGTDDDFSIRKAALHL